MYLPPDDDTLTTDSTAGTAVLLITIRLGAASLRRLSDVTTAGATAIKLDAVTLAGDAVALAVADRRGRVTHGRQRRRGRAAGRAGRKRRADGAGRAVGVRVLV